MVGAPVQIYLPGRGTGAGYHFAMAWVQGAKKRRQRIDMFADLELSLVVANVD